MCREKGKPGPPPRRGRDWQVKYIFDSDLVWQIQLITIDG